MLERDTLLFLVDDPCSTSGGASMSENPGGALLLVDMQQESQYGIEGVDEAVAAAESVTEACRAAGLPVVYARHVNRADGAGLSVGEVLDPAGMPVHYRAGTPAVEIIDAIAPHEQRC
jgi:nicotinamidase-related amidase